MTLHGWGWASLLLMAGLALWLLLAGAGDLLGVDIGSLGMALLITTAWVSLTAVSRIPRGELEQGIAPGEWKAWIGTVFMGVATLYFAKTLPGFQSESIPDVPSARVVVRNLVMLLIAWTVLSRVLASRWQGRVQADERDREIEARAVGWGRGLLIVAVVTLAVTLGLSPAERLDWATPFMIGNLLILLLMCGWLVEYATTAALYWHDRRGVA